MSDDSLEVIVVKKSLEKKCEKVVSGRRSKTPRESTRETKLTKMRKRSSKRVTRSSKSKTSDNEGNTTGRDDSPDKEEKDVQAEESAERARRRTSGKPVKNGEDAKADGMESRIMESRYGVDATDSTSQETVERVVVTAMVHEDQTPDTPKSTLETSPPSGKEDVSPSNLSLPANKSPEGTQDVSGVKSNETAMSSRPEDTRLEEANDEREGRTLQPCRHVFYRCIRYR